MNFGWLLTVSEHSSSRIHPNGGVPRLPARAVSGFHGGPGAHAGISRQSITKRFNGQSSKLARRSLASGWSMEVASAHGGAEKISCEVREHQGVRGEFISGLEILAASAARCSQRFVFVDHGSSWGRT
jgi:hypothetical protein